MPELERDGGVRLYYDAQGEGPAVLLTHGFCATARMWDPQAAALAERYRVIRWDMRGHGRTSCPAEQRLYTHEACVADMEAVLDACGADAAVVGGLSLGGFLSLAFHLERSHRVRALMLFDTGPGYKNDAARAEWNRYAEDNARALEAKGAAALRDSAEVHAEEHESMDGLVMAARGILVQRDGRVIESLPSIRVSTLLVAGADDEPFLTGMAYMAKKIPGARHELIAGAGHAPNLEQPAAFNRIVGEFLDGV